MKIIRTTVAASLAVLASCAAFGLKLDPKRSPVEILIIDKADKVPTEN